MAIGNSGAEERVNRVAFETTDSCIPDQFQKTAAKYPSRVAIGSGAWQPTYAELDFATNSLANVFQRRAAQGGRVALLQRLDGFLIGSILGGLKARRPIAVFNTSDPLPRLRQDLLEVDPAIMVSDTATHELALQIAPEGVPVLLFSDAVAGGAANRASDALPMPPTPSGPEDSAFLIRTSGTSGRSKWVMQTHPNLLHNAGRHNLEMRVCPDDRILLLASPSGSQAVATMFFGLLNGAAICPFPISEKGILGLAGWIRQHNITVYVSAASAFRHFLKTLGPDESFPLVRLVKVGAEAVLAADLSAAATHFPANCVYYCTYSCAEAGNMMQLRVSGSDLPSGTRLPLGNPAEGTVILLCDEEGRLVADGEAGEIVVRSRFLSPGYWRNEKLTAERFTEVAGDGTRDYRTGDLGRREPDGALYCIGRLDDVVKIRGNRVGIAAVEEAIAALPGVQESAVCIRDQTNGSVRLVAFVVARPGTVGSVRMLRQALASTLPDYMLPTEITFVESLPLNPHGKIDREALLARPADVAPESQSQLSTPTEVLLARIWEETFDSGRIGREASFFHLGGDSLTAGVVAAKAHDAFAVDLNMLDFAEHPRLRNLASRIDRLREGGAASGLPPIERAQQRSQYPLSFSQEAIWRHSQNAEVHRRYTVARSFSLRGPLNVDALREAMTCVARRNEIVRTTFSVVDGKPAQIVQPPEPVELPLVDLSGLSDARERGVARLREEARCTLDLERGPLLRHTLIRIAPDEHWLLRLSHHILYDGWSWKLYFQELESAYESVVTGSSPSLECKDLQYGDYATWERSVYSAGCKARAQLATWWKSTLTNQPARLGLPFRRRRLFPRRVKPSDGWLWSGLDAEVRSRLRDLARQESTTHYVIGIAAFSALLASITGQSKLIVGIHVTNRDRVALQNMQGNFTRLVPLPLEYSGAGTFLHWLSVVRTQIVAIQAHAQVPREELWDDLRSQGVSPPDIEAIFGGPGLVLPTKFGELDLTAHSHNFRGLESEGPAAMPWGFNLSFDLNNEEHQCELTFDARINDPAKVRSFLQTYLRLLDRLSLASDEPMERVICTAFEK